MSNSDTGMGNLDSQQLIAVEALEEIKRICDLEGIHFYLLSGSLLGAVRHGGMIPWDDDVDIGFLYDDWYKIRKLLPQKINRKFEYADDETEKNWPIMFSKVLYQRRTCVDLFLLSKWTSDPIEGYIHWNISRFARGLYSCLNCFFPPVIITGECGLIQIIRKKLKLNLKKLISIIGNKLIKKESCIRLARWNEQFFEKQKTDYYINLYSVYSMKKEMIPAAWIEKSSYIQYEGNLYETVGDADAYLKHLYGDYMQLPSEEKRVRHHSEEF